LSYLLDTNVCIAVINGRPREVVERFDREALGGAELFVSTISRFELWYGVAKSQQQEFNRIRLEIFLAGSVQLLPFGEDDPLRAGEVRALLEKQGTPRHPQRQRICPRARPAIRGLAGVAARLQQIAAGAGGQGEVEG
jgi:tRNA(fMet)-specific endonuclease VapC